MKTSFFITNLILSVLLIATIGLHAQAPIALLKQNVVLLKDVVGNSDNSDLDKASAYWSDKKIIALGEASHGTKEFFQMKHRLFQYLAENHGFRVFLMEATFAECFEVNEYVMYGKGDEYSALKAMEGNGWQTVEVLEMLKWMRKFNANRNDTDKIRFHGFDLIYTKKSTQYFLEYLQKVDPDYAKSLDSVLADFGNDQLHFYGSSPEKGQVSAWNSQLMPVVSRFETNKDKYIEKSSVGAYGIARQFLRVMEQALKILQGGNRDEYLAENVKWWINHEAPGARIMIWAHNGHITFGETDRLGYFLKKDFRDDYYAIGFDFHTGSVLVHEGSGYFAKPLNPGLPGSFGAEFTKCDISIFFVDFQQCATNKSLKEYVSVPRLHRFIGAGFEREEDAYQKVSLPLHYNALIFVDKTNAADWTRR